MQSNEEKKAVAQIRRKRENTKSKQLEKRKKNTSMPYLSTRRASMLAKKTKKIIESVLFASLSHIVSSV